MEVTICDLPATTELASVGRCLNAISSTTLTPFPIGSREAAKEFSRGREPAVSVAVYAVFRVALNGQRPTIDEIIDRELVWHREAARIAPRARGLVRLLVE